MNASQLPNMKQATSAHGPSHEGLMASTSAPLRRDEGHLSFTWYCWQAWLAKLREGIVALAAVYMTVGDFGHISLAGPSDSVQYRHPVGLPTALEEMWCGTSPARIQWHAVMSVGLVHREPIEIRTDFSSLDNVVMTYCCCFNETACLVVSAHDHSVDFFRRFACGIPVEVLAGASSWTNLPENRAAQTCDVQCGPIVKVFEFCTSQLRSTWTVLSRDFARCGSRSSEFFR